MAENNDTTTNRVNPLENRQKKLVNTLMSE